MTAVSQVRCKPFSCRYLARVVAAQHAAVLGDGSGVQADWAAAANRAEQVTQRQRLQALQRQEAPLTGGLASAGVSSIHTIRRLQAGWQAQACPLYIPYHVEKQVLWSARLGELLLALNSHFL